jgi:hypothetical protein
MPRRQRNYRNFCLIELWGQTVLNLRCAAQQRISHRYHCVHPPCHPNAFHRPNLGGAWTRLRDFRDSLLVYTVVIARSLPLRFIRRAKTIFAEYRIFLRFDLHNPVHKHLTFRMVLAIHRALADGCLGRGDWAELNIRSQLCTTRRVC